MLIPVPSEDVQCGSIVVYQGATGKIAGAKSTAMLSDMQPDADLVLTKYRNGARGPEIEFVCHVVPPSNYILLLK